MRVPPIFRTLAAPASATYKRLLARFPIARVPGSFLCDSLPVELLPYRAEGEPSIQQVGWQLVTSRQYAEDEYLKWCRAMDVLPSLNRKQWEWVYILQVLEQNGMLREGTRGIGFGCGKEPLASVMAHRGCQLVVTDLDEDEAAKSGWVVGGQHSARLNDLCFPGICSPELFLKQASFRACDMNAIQEDLVGFDFAWSSCALEHLGSLELGLRFIEKSLNCLRPGGVAVHTTEFNLGSNERTLESGAASIYRKRDIEELALRLLRRGHGIGLINFAAGNEAPDRYVDLPPYRSPIHLRLIIKRHLSTSLGLFVTRGTS